MCTQFRGYIHSPFKKFQYLTASSSSSSPKIFSRSEMSTMRSFSLVKGGFTLASDSSGFDSSEQDRQHEWHQILPVICHISQWLSVNWPDFGAELKMDMASFPSGTTPLPFTSSGCTRQDKYVTENCFYMKWKDTKSSQPYRSRLVYKETVAHLQTQF